MKRRHTEDVGIVYLLLGVLQTGLIAQRGGSQATSDVVGQSFDVFAQVPDAVHESD